MKKLICAAALAVVLSGCVSAPIKTVDSANALQGKTIVLSEYAKPDFLAQTPGKAMFGLIGVAGMIHAGNELVQEDGIADPSIAIGEKIAQDLESTRGETLLSNHQVVAANDDVPTLLKTYPGADLIIDIKTIGWSYIYYPSHWNTYHVLYTSRLRVLDGRNGNLVAQALCKSGNGDPNTAPSGDELLADHGKVLKGLLQKVGDDCVAIYEKQILKV